MANGKELMRRVVKTTGLMGISVALNLSLSPIDKVNKAHAEESKPLNTGESTTDGQPPRSIVNFSTKKPDTSFSAGRPDASFSAEKQKEQFKRSDKGDVKRTSDEKPAIRFSTPKN